MTNKATQATAQIGRWSVTCFMLPSGMYRMALSRVAEFAGKHYASALRFLSRCQEALDIEILLRRNYLLEKIEPASEEPPVAAISLEMTAAYWLGQSGEGNEQAQTLVWALLSECLERRFDATFNIERSEEERNDTLAKRIQPQQTGNYQ